MEENFSQKKISKDITIFAIEVEDISTKGKRFELFSTGTEDGFNVLDKGVP